MRVSVGQGWCVSAVACMEIEVFPTSDRGCTREFPIQKETSFGFMWQKNRDFSTPSFADFVNQPFVLNRPLGYNYHSIAKPCLLCWLHSNTGVDDEIMAS